MKLIGLLLFLAFFSVVCHSQDTASQKATGKKSGVEFYLSPGAPFPPGFQVTDISGLGNRLKSVGLPSVTSQKQVILSNTGIGLACRFNKILVGFELYALTSYTNNDTMRYSGSYSQIYLSTNIIKIKHCIISPLVGFERQSIVAVVTNPSRATDFNSALTTSSNQTELGISNAMLDFAVEIKKYYPANGRIRPLLIVGYKAGLKKEMWQINQAEVIDGPKDSAGSFYIQCILGIGK